MRWVWSLAVVALLIAGGISPRASAKECKLQAIPINLVPNNQGEILMALQVNHQPANFILDTGAAWSVIRPSKIGDLRVQNSNREMFGVGGGKSGGYVKLPSLSIGPIEIHDMDMYIGSDATGAADSFGLIGANIIKSLDLEINLAENKLNFFLPNDCGERVVYWKNDGVAEVDFHENYGHQITFQMKLDGANIWAILDTGATLSEMTMLSASRLFDLEPDSPGVEKSGFSTGVHGEVLALYRHRFNSLEVEGLKFNKPWLTISNITKKFDYDFLLGMHELRGLHFYISYRDRKIYFTKASLEVADNPLSEPAPAPAVELTMDALDWQLIGPYLDRAEAASKDDKYDEALAALNDLIAHYPDYAIGYYRRALVQHKRGDEEAALADLNRAISLFPSYGEAYRQRSELRHAKHDEDGAKADLNMAAKSEPSSASTFRVRAELRAQARDYDGALSDATRAIELDPKFILAYAIRAQVYFLQKDYEHALADYRQINQLDPKKAYALQGIGNALHRMGREDEALISFSQAIDLAPKNASCLNSRCWQLAMMGRFQDAVDDCDNGIDLAPKWHPVIDSRGYVYLKLHQLKRSISDFDKALEINPKSAHSMYGRSLAKQELGDTKGAEADLAAATKLQSDIAQHFPE